MAEARNSAFFATSPIVRSVDTTTILFKSTPGLHPLAKVRFDELLDARAAGQAHQEGALLPFLPQLDVEERTAEVFAGRPFGDQAEGRGVRGELELVTVAQFADVLDYPAQGGAKLVKMPLAVRGSERRTVAGEGGLLRNRLAGDDRAEQHNGRNEHRSCF